MYLLLFLVIGASIRNTNAVYMDTMVTNQADSSYFVNGAPKDCQISASDQVVGVYCAEQKYLFFHKKDEFFNGDLSTQSKNHDFSNFHFQLINFRHIQAAINGINSKTRYRS